MPQWDNSRFESTAKDLAKTWHATRSVKGASLTTLVEKTARDNSLNPEQITRLANITNGHAFNEVFNAAKTAGEKERYPDFDIADAKSVIAELFKSAADPTEKQAAFYPKIEDQFAPERSRPDPLEANMKLASAQIMAKNVDRLLGYEPTPFEKFAGARDALDFVRTKKAGANIRWEDSLAKLREKAAYATFDQDSFEVNAVALLGFDAVPEINQLRKEAGQKTLPLDAAKYAAFQERNVGVLDVPTQLLKQAIDARKEYEKWSAAFGVAEEDLKKNEALLREPR